ncbi:MAG: hypothetical protein DMF90_25285 [Acidobacteria bacterium]|nr:MAG: hypothetical protein DMF90_25285 [Acidobacteriota bacterium]
MLRHARSQGTSLDWTFYCVVGHHGSLDEEARSLGAQVVHSPVPLRRKAAFIRALRTELRRGGYDVLHCHHDLVSAVYLLASAGLKLRRRIVHVHNADETVPTPKTVSYNGRPHDWNLRPYARHVSRRTPKKARQGRRALLRPGSSSARNCRRRSHKVPSGAGTSARRVAAALCRPVGTRKESNIRP